MYADCVSDSSSYASEFCSCHDPNCDDIVLCRCAEWLNGATELQLNKYISILADHLYGMRCAIVHDATTTHFVSQPLNEDDEGIEMYDVYTKIKVQGRRRCQVYVPYSTELTATKVVDIFCVALWNYFIAPK